MYRQGMNLVAAYAIGTVLGLSITLGVVARVAERVGAAESGIHALVCAPASLAVPVVQAREPGGLRSGG